MSVKKLAVGQYWCAQLADDSGRVATGFLFQIVYADLFDADPPSFERYRIWLGVKVSVDHDPFSEFRQCWWFDDSGTSFTDEASGVFTLVRKSRADQSWRHKRFARHPSQPFPFTVQPPQPPQPLTKGALSPTRARALHDCEVRPDCARFSPAPQPMITAAEYAAERGISVQQVLDHAGWRVPT